MKKSVLIFSIVAGFTGLVLSSYEHGPAYEGGINRTGSTGGAANCAGSGCHASNVSTTEVKVTVTNSAGVSVSSYVPGSTYTVTMTGHNVAPGIDVNEFGFQVSAVLSSSSAQAGTFAVASGTNLRVTNLAGLQIVEHKNVLADSATNYSVARFSWTAPAAGSGNVQFYGILNAIGSGGGSGSGSSGGRLSSGSGSDTSSGGEYPNTSPVVMLTENGGGTSAVNDVTGINGLNVFPNPCSTELNIVTNDAGTYAVRIFAANGVLVYSTSIVTTSTASNTIATQQLPAGIYNVELASGNKRAVKAIVKN